MNLLLPDDPMIGQEYVIMMSNADGTSVQHGIYGSSDCQIVDTVGEKPAQTSVAVSAKGMVKLVCADNGSGVKRWWFYRLA